MANRFPLIVNPATQKIEELVAGDNLDLTNNGVIANNTSGTNGQYLKTNGSTVVWDNPGDVYLSTIQTVSNKTFTDCTLSGASNTFSAIPNVALINSSITVNGVPISLGGSVTTPDNNTTYSISAQDGAAGKKIIRLTSGGNFGSGVNDDITLSVSTYSGTIAANHKVANLYIDRIGDEITLSATAEDIDTITRIKGGSAGSFVTGDVTFLPASGSTTQAAGGVYTTTGATTLSQSGNTITVGSSYVNTVTRLRGTSSGSYTSGDVTISQAGATTVTQNASDITISSQDTITRLTGTGAGANLTAGDFTFTSASATASTAAGGVTTVTGAATITQSGTTFTIDSTYVNTVTRLRGTTTGTYTSGDLTITGTNDVTVTQTGSTINIDVIDNDTTYSASASGGLSLAGTVFSLKNNANLSNNIVQKWDDTNNQLTNSIITDDGSTITVSGNLTVTGTTTTVESTTVVVADNEIELRKGTSIVGANGGIKLNRTTNSVGGVLSYTSLNWNESGGYWRVFDGTTTNRLVTENETQTLTNKTLTSPTLTTPSLGVATATSINGITLTAASGSTVTLAASKTLTVNNTLTFSGTDGSTIGFGSGGTVLYTTSKISALASTTSTELRGVISDETGSGSLVFGTSPTIITSILTTSSSFDLLNATATTINFGGAATTVNIGAATGTTTVKNNLAIDGNTTIGSASNDSLTVNALTTFNNSDISIAQIRIGRGPGSNDAIKDLNTVVGRSALNANTTGTQNVAFGYEAALGLTSGASNTALGYRALRGAGIGAYNIAVGRDALLQITNGSHNIGIGTNTLEANLVGIGNVAIGRYAGAGATGSGNVLIGPATDENSTNQTHTPPSPTGNNQLVIATGSLTWLRGDSAGDITFPYNVSILGTQTFGANTTFNGQTSNINSTTISIASKALTIGSVSNRTFTATVQNANNTITGVTPTTGLIPGMVVSISTGGISVPAGTQIVSITNNSIVLSNNVTGSTGTATFNAVGPSDTSADGGGLTLKGTTDKKITWTSSTNAWTSTENFDLASGKQYRIGNVLIASGSQIGPSTGSFSLGAGVTSSSLTSVGTLTSLNISNSGSAVGLTITNTGTGDCFVVNDESGDITPFKIDNAGAIYINSNIVDTTGSTGSNNQVLTRRNPSGVQWVGINTLADPNTVTNAGTSTDNAIARFDLATGKVIQNSGVTISDTNNLSTPGVITSTFATTGSASLTIQNDSAISLANNTFSIAKTVYGGIHFNTTAGTGGAARQAAITFRGNSTDEAQAGIYVINNNTIGTAMTLATTDNYTTGPQQGLTISHLGDVTVNRGNLVIGTSGKGIDFSANANAAGMTSELLDDYEEGTWTPGINSRVVSTPEGTYTKIGRQVLVRFLVQGLDSSISSTAFGITGLPFTSSNLNQNGAAYIADTSGVTYASTDYGNIYGRVNSNSTEIQILQKRNDGSSHDTFGVGGGLGTGVVLRGYAWYTTDS